MSAGVTGPAVPHSGAPRRVFLAGMTAPGAIATVGLVLFPLSLVLLLGFRHNDGSLLGAGFTISNFAAALGDPFYAKVLLRSLAIAGLVTLATVVTAYPVAYYLAFHAGPKRALLLFLVTLPFWTSYLLRVFAWKIVLAYNGVLNSALLDDRAHDRADPGLSQHAGGRGRDACACLCGVRHPADLRRARDHSALAASRRPPISARIPSLSFARSSCRCRCRACSLPRSSSSCRRSATTSRRPWSAGRRAP